MTVSIDQARARTADSDAESHRQSAAARPSVSAVNTVCMLLLGLWLGAAILFSFAVAPTVFTVLPARELAGAVVTRVLGIVNVAGFIISLLILIGTFFIRTSASKRVRVTHFISLLVIAITTAVGHWVIASRLQGLRIAMGRPIDLVAIDDPLRVAFNNLHGYSVLALGIAMIAALAAFFFSARR